jgi:hypothetical protein
MYRKLGWHKTCLDFLKQYQIRIFVGKSKKLLDLPTLKLITKPTEVFRISRLIRPKNYLTHTPSGRVLEGLIVPDVIRLPALKGTPWFNTVLQQPANIL